MFTVASVTQSSMASRLVPSIPYGSDLLPLSCMDHIPTDPRSLKTGLASCLEAQMRDQTLEALNRSYFHVDRDNRLKSVDVDPRQTVKVALMHAPCVFST